MKKLRKNTNHSTFYLKTSKYSQWKLDRFRQNRGE